MTDKTMKEAIDDWERAANEFINETKKVGATASKKLEQQLKALQDEGAKLVDSYKHEGEDADEKLGRDLERRYNVIKDKLRRTWEELNK